MAALGAGAATPPAAAQVTQDPQYGGVRRTTLSGPRSADPPSLDPFASGDDLSQIVASHHYSRLTPTLPDLMGQLGRCSYWSTASRGDGVSGWPEILDAATYVFWEPGNISWQDVEPVSGRPVDLEDVAASLEYLRSQRHRSYWWDDTEVSAPRLHSQALGRNLELSLAKPNSWIFESLFSRDLWIAPRELIADGLLAERPIGSGPWIFERHVPREQIQWRYHPNWHPETSLELPIMDGVVAGLNGDERVILQQLVEGQLDMSEISYQMYRELEDAAPQIEIDIFHRNFELGGFFFQTSSPPWNDARLRIALSRALDRFWVMDQAGDRSPGRWLSGLPALRPYELLEPADRNRFGQTLDGVPSGLNFEYDPDSARELLEAAGYPDGVSATLHAIRPRDPAQLAMYEACVQSVAAHGFRFRLVIHETELPSSLESGGRQLEHWLTQVSGQAEGQIGIGPVTGRLTNPGDVLRDIYGGYASSLGSSESTAEASGGPIADRYLQDLIKAQREELDWESRRELLIEIQRYLATQM